MPDCLRRRDAGTAEPVRGQRGAAREAGAADGSLVAKGTPRMAYIDQLRAIAFSAKSGHKEDACQFARLIYSRFSEFDFADHSLPSPQGCTGVRLTHFGFVLSFGNLHVNYSRHQQRWLASTFSEDSPTKSDAHHVAVERLGVPFAFLEGISFCIECFEEIGMANVKNQKLDFEQKQLDIQIKNYVAWKQNIGDIEKRAKSKYWKRMARTRAEVFASLHETPEPPIPPTDTVSLDIARRAFAGVSGVYFLWDCDEIKYVGRADCIGSRLSPSHHRAKPGHRVSVVSMSIEDSWVAENFYIWKFRPELNGPILQAARAAAKRQPVEAMA